MPYCLAISGAFHFKLGGFWFIAGKAVPVSSPFPDYQFIAATFRNKQAMYKARL